MQLRPETVLTGNGLSLTQVCIKRHRLNDARPRGSAFSSAIDPSTFDFLMGALIDQYADIIDGRAHCNDISNKNYMTRSQLQIDTYNLGCMLRVAPLLNRAWRDAAFADVRWRWLVYFHIHLPQAYLLFGDARSGGLTVQEMINAVSMADRDCFRCNDRTPASIPALYWDEDTRAALAPFADCDPSVDTIREIPGREALRPTERLMLPCAYRSRAELNGGTGTFDMYRAPLLQQSGTAFNDSIYSAMAVMHAPTEDYNGYWGLRLAADTDQPDLAGRTAHAVKSLKLDSIGMPANLPAPIKAWVVRKMVVRERLFREKCVERWMSDINGSLYHTPVPHDGQQLPTAWDVVNATWGPINSQVMDDCWPSMTALPCGNAACSRKCRARLISPPIVTDSAEGESDRYEIFEDERRYDHWLTDSLGNVYSHTARSSGSVHKILQAAQSKACYDRHYRAHITPAHNLLLATQPSDQQSFAREHPNFHPHATSTLIHAHVLPFSPLFRGYMYNHFAANQLPGHSYLHLIGLNTSPKMLLSDAPYRNRMACSFACAKAIFDELVRYSLFAMVPSQELFATLKTLEQQIPHLANGVPTPAQTLEATWAIHNELVRQHGVAALTVMPAGTGDERNAAALPELKHADWKALRKMRDAEIDAFNVHLGLVVAAATAAEVARNGAAVGTVPGLRRMSWAVYSSTPSLSDNAVRKIKRIYETHGCIDGQERTLCAVPTTHRSLPHWLKKVQRHTKAGDIFKS